MKKILTLTVLLSCGAIATTFAQQGDRDRYDHAGQNNPYVKTYPTVVNDHDRDNYQDRDHNRYAQREMQIARINRETDFRIAQINNDRFMNRRTKRREIAAIESQRRMQIQSLGNERFDRR